MQIIISHDVDHLSVSEHLCDLIVPKFVLRSHLELALGAITFAELGRRLKGLVENRWQNLDALMDFDKANGIPATFFVAVSQGKGLAYRAAPAARWVRRIAANGFEVGVHGIAFNAPQAVQAEAADFRELSGKDPCGIRMHYLRTDDTTLSLLANAGYSFDSSTCSSGNPYRIGAMWEFPLHVMDGHVIYNGRRWQRDPLDVIKRRTEARIMQLRESGVEFLSVLFHDRYFSDAFVTWRDWYLWLVQYCKDQDMGFTDYRSAMNELNRRPCTPAKGIRGQAP